MSPVIRLSDSTYQRLETHAIGFDTPSNVIERLMDFFESHSINLESQKSKLEEVGMITRPVKRPPVLKKKPRDPGKEMELKKAIGKTLNWGEFRLISSTVLEFQASLTKVLCKYSSYSEHHKWFWGVGRKYWSKWDENWYLALLMENEDQASYSYLLLEPNQASLLFSKCHEHEGEKKINLRFYKSDGLPHFQEWQDYDVEKNMRTLQT